MRRIELDRKSIKTRLMAAFILTSIVPILLANIFSYYNTSRLVKQNGEGMTLSNLEQVNVNLNIWLESYEDILLQVYTDDRIVELVDRINKGEDVANNRQSLRRILRGLFYTKDYVKAITVITESGEQVFYDQLTASTTNTSWMDSMSMSGKDLYAEISRDNSTHLLRTGEKITFGSSSYYLFHIGHRIIDYRDVQKMCGIVIVSIDEELLRGVCRPSGGQEDFNGLNFIVDDEGYIISCAGSEETGRQLFSPYTREEEKTEAYRNLARRTGILEKGKISVYSVYNRNLGWSIIRAVNEEQLLSSLRQQQQFMMVITLISLLLVLVIIIYQVNRMTGSIKRVTRAMRKAGKGDLSAHVEADATRPTEVEIIAEEFNSTMDKLKISMNKEREAAERQKNAEIAALEAQINPHFLYNTLDTINWMAIDKEDYEISGAISALAAILRYGISDSNGTVRIKEEAEWLRQYIFLQQTRLKNTFQCSINIEPDIMDLPIHKLLLQPFVENAILHGFEGVNRQHSLLIDMRRQGEQIQIRIEDNGSGMPEKLRDEINSGIFQKSMEKKHIGMENAVTRMRMYYGEAAGFHIDSVPGKGTVIWILIPAGEEEKDIENSSY